MCAQTSTGGGLGCLLLTETWHFDPVQFALAVLRNTPSADRV
jgi:hypothetical protein